MGQQASNRLTWRWAESVATEVTPADIEAAATRVAGHVRRTPVLDLGDAMGRGFDLILKLEHLQVTGSFKARGAFSLMTTLQRTDGGVVAASGGNFGAAVAHAGSQLGMRTTIFVPETSPREKIDRIRLHGADVRVVAGYYDDARREAEGFAAETGATQAHAYDQSDVVAGQGTVAVEIEDQADPDLVLVAVGGGGLIAGVASWLRDRSVIVAVEPERCDSFRAALVAGHPVEVDVSGVAASSLGARQVGSHAWAVRSWIDRSILVTDEAIIEAQRWIWSTVRLVVEPAAAATVAALRTEAMVPESGSRVVAVISGGNVDPGSVA